jgi:hypothetical protein
MDDESKIKCILTQTNYTREIAVQKYEEFNLDHIAVISDYMGIKHENKKKQIKPKYLNQEIFKQIRTEMDNSMRQYREQHPIDMNQVVNNLRESENQEKQRTKNANA